MESRVKTLRQLLGMSQEQLAEKAGVSQPQVCKIELKVQSPGTQLLKYIREIHGAAKAVLEEEIR